MSARRGSALLELLTAATLLSLVMAVSVVLLHAGSVVLRNTSERSALDEALRTSEGVVRSELRPLTVADLHGAGNDSVSARITRGVGIVCDTLLRTAVLRYRGLRLPDPAKDSLLVLGDERSMTFRASDRTARCNTLAAEELVAVQPAEPLRPGAVVLLFETGAYHIATHALRYRRAGETRQPLTDELLDDRASRFILERNGRGVRLLLRATAPGVSGSSDTRFRLLNP